MNLYEQLKPIDRLFARRARRAGVPKGWASVVIYEQRGVKSPGGRGLALAMVQTESGFTNVYGHDPTIFRGAGTVTRDNYHDYKQRRDHGGPGRGGMQGVGPMQLTWYEYQDAADREGGAYMPAANIRTGLRVVRDLIHVHGFARGIARYNGTGPAATAYSATVRRRARAWTKILLTGRGKRPL